MKTLITVIVLAIIVFVTYSIVTKDDLQVDELVEHMNTYNSGKYGLEFKYPDGYVLTERETGNAERARYTVTLVREEDSIPPRNGEGPTAITFDIYQNNLDKQTPLDWLKNTDNSNFKLSDGKYSTTTVGGVEGLSYSWSGLYEANAIVFPHKENIVAATVTFITPEDENIDVFADIVESIELH